MGSSTDGRRFFFQDDCWLRYMGLPDLRYYIRAASCPCKELGQQPIPTDLSTGSSAATASSACSAGSIAADIIVLDSRKAVTALLTLSKTERCIATSTSTVDNVSAYASEFGTKLSLT